MLILCFVGFFSPSSLQIPFHLPGYFLFRFLPRCSAQYQLWLCPLAAAGKFFNSFVQLCWSPEQRGAAGWTERLPCPCCPSSLCGLRRSLGHFCGGTEGPPALCSVPGSVGTLLSMKKLNPNSLKRLRKATTSSSLRFGTISPSRVRLQGWGAPPALPQAPTPNPQSSQAPERLSCPSRDGRAGTPN